MTACLHLMRGTLAAALMLAALPAQAQEQYFPNFGAELRVGLYRPVINNNSEVEKVRDKVFGSGTAYYKHPPLFSFEFDYYPFNEGFGLLGIYGRAGFWHDQAASRKCLSPTIKDPTNPGSIVACNADSIQFSETGSDTATLTVVPASVGVIYRYDVLRRNTDIPLVFTGKLGLDYSLWWGGVGDSTPKISGTGHAAKGGNLGWSGSVSVALALDYFSRNAPEYGREKSIQYNYVFLEYALIDGKYLFNSKPLIDLSDYTVVLLGLGLDFR